MIFELSSCIDQYLRLTIDAIISGFRFFQYQFVLALRLSYLFRNVLSFFTAQTILLIYFIIMRQLKKIRSQELLDRLFSDKIKQNYYEHHNLPIRSSQKNFYKTTNVPHRSLKQSRFEKTKKMEMGRQLFPEMMKKMQDPGPGFYDEPEFKSAKGYRFTTHSQLQKKIIMTHGDHKLGPGFYKYDNVASKNLLSQNKQSLVTKFSKSPKKEERLTFKVIDGPGPAKYENLQNITKMSNHTIYETHAISKTSRSSLVRGDKLPGPGYYDWQQFYDKNKEKKKPCIEYKFVYDHPS